VNQNQIINDCAVRRGARTFICRATQHGVECTKIVLALLSVSILIASHAQAQTVTIGGTVRDSLTLLPISGARVDLVNLANPAEHYTVSTDLSGEWKYVFQSSGVGTPPGLPLEFSLEQNYPNPFNPSTTIRFALRREGNVTLSVHNVLGQLLDSKRLFLQPGGYEIVWSSKGAAGALFYSIEAGGVRLVKKMIQLDGGSGTGWGELRVAEGVALASAPMSLTEAEYSVTASKLGYEPDSTTILRMDGARENLSLETVHHRALVADLHNDILESVVLGYQLGVLHTDHHSDLPRFKEGGMDLQMFVSWVDPTSGDSTTYYQSAVAMIDSFEVQILRNPSALEHVTTAAGALQAISSGKLAGLLNIEGGHSIQSDLAKLIDFYLRGARAMTITWNNSTSWAVSAQDPRSATVGLSAFGKSVIQKMDSLGMIIDVSHTGIKTIQDILATTTHPIIASHSGARALNNHYRNLTDDQIRSIAQTGGVIGVVFYPYFLSPTHRATIDTVIRHIDYIKNLVGIDYVALGSDFDGIDTVPVGLEDVSHLPSLTLALLQHGYTPAEVRKILGQNFMRVLTAVCH
jgi:membrane dipeptidase